MRRSLDETDARRLMTGGPVMLVTCSFRGRHNAMPVAYAMNLSMRPPLIGLAVHPQRHTYDIIRRTEEFALNIPTRDLLHHVQYLGTLSGADFDKLELTKLPYFKARKLDTVLLEGCVGWIECSLQDAIEMGDHFLLVGRVVAVQADDDAFNERWLLPDQDSKPLHYLGGNYYSMLDYVMEARIPKSAEEYGKRLDEAVAEQLELTKEGEERRAQEDYEREEFRKREGFDSLHES
jgi:flavin reductase (DIM6/NTAB) family NADH-FMN oxidoreductase RutF